MSWIFGAETIAVKMAGEHANATIAADTTTLTYYSDMIEGIIEVETGKTYVSDHSSLPTGVKFQLNAVHSAWIANLIVAYDVSGYLAREADTILNVNDAIIKSGLRFLKDYSKIKLKSPL